MSYANLYKVKVGDTLVLGTTEYRITQISYVDENGLWGSFTLPKSKHIAMISTGLFIHNKYTLIPKEPKDKKQAVLDKIKYLDDQYTNARLRNNDIQQGEPV